LRSDSHGDRNIGEAQVTADDIEHEGAITERVIEEIETSEFHIADLTGERPNVYYEVGYAHARNKRVILCRKTDAKLHFDLAHRNVPEYANIFGLRDFLRKRLEVVTNKPKKA
jgi:nucleoside 2-deoxyribosyltransferase